MVSKGTADHRAGSSPKHVRNNILFAPECLGPISPGKGDFSGKFLVCAFTVQITPKESE
jgi:hypothetical protein